MAVKEVLAFAEGWLPALQEREATSSTPHQRPISIATGPSSPMGQTTPGTMERMEDARLADPLKLIEEVNTLIQKRLQEQPDLAQRGIRLTRDIDGHLLIYVGQQHYRSADEIPDNVVRSFIQETIRMWENQ